MTVIQYWNTFRTFGADVLLLALGVTLVTSLFKKTVFKNCSRKLFVFLPFVVGLVVYAAYRAIATLSVIPFTGELCKTVEGGFACGCAATLYYVVYEQFFRTNKTGSKTLFPVSPLLEGYLPDDKIAEAAEKLTNGYRGLTGDKLLSFVHETLERYALPEVSKTGLASLSKLIAEFLLTLAK